MSVLKVVTWAPDLGVSACTAPASQNGAQSSRKSMIAESPIAKALVWRPHIVETGVAHMSCANPIFQRHSGLEPDPDDMRCRDDVCRADPTSDSCASNTTFQLSPVSQGATRSDRDVVLGVDGDALSEPGMGRDMRLPQKGDSNCMNLSAAAVPNPAHRVAPPCVSTLPTPLPSAKWVSAYRVVTDMLSHGDVERVEEPASSCCGKEGALTSL